MKEKADDELVALGLAGAAQALEELYARYRAPILGYAYRMTGDRSLAEDVFQETFVYFFEHLRRYEPRGKLGAYLFRIARNMALDERAAARRSRPEEGRPWAYSPAPPADAPAEEREAAAISEARARQAILGLSPLLREVVELRVYQGFEYARIAEITGVSEPTARSRMRYALEALRASLGIQSRRAAP